MLTLLLTPTPPSASERERRPRPAAAGESREAALVCVLCVPRSLARPQVEHELPRRGEALDGVLRLVQQFLRAVQLRNDLCQVVRELANDAVLVSSDARELRGGGGRGRQLSMAAVCLQACSKTTPTNAWRRHKRQTPNA